MAITVTVGAGGKVDNCLFDDNLMSSKVSALTIGALGVVTNTQWYAGAATSAITLGADAVIDSSYISVFDSLVMSGARAAVKDSILYFKNAGDAALSGDGASIQDTVITTMQQSGTEAVLLSGNNTQVDNVLFDIQTTQTTDIYDCVRVTGDFAQVAMRLQRLNGVRKWNYAVTIDATADGTRIGHISVDETNLLASGVISDSGTDTVTETVFPDNRFAVHDNTDISKILNLQLSTITTGTTRTWTVPDASGTVTIDGLLLAGGTMSGAITMGGFSIVNAGDIEVDSVTPASADISFFKQDGTTVSLLWDESDDQWEFATDVVIEGQIQASGNLTISAGTLILAQTQDTSLVDGTGALQVGPSGTQNVGFDQNQIQARSGSAGAALFINTEGGDLGLHGFSGAGRTAMYFIGNDIRLLKANGSTVSLLWDESDDRWEFNTSVTIDQPSTTAALPVLTLDQADVSEEMIEFVTTIGVGNAIEAIGAKTLTTTHFIKITIPGGLTRYIPAGTIA